MGLVCSLLRLVPPTLSLSQCPSKARVGLSFHGSSSQGPMVPKRIARLLWGASLWAPPLQWYFREFLFRNLEQREITKLNEGTKIYINVCYMIYVG